MNRDIIAAALLVALPAAGCSNDFAVPEGINISCASEKDCPAGWTCNTNMGRCIKTANLDSTAPVITGKPKITPTLARKGIEIRASFDVSEPLVETPKVVVDLRGKTVSMTLDEAKSKDTHFEFTYTPRGKGTEPETTCQVLATLIDQGGNRSEGLLLGTVVFDFTLPKLVSAKVEPPFAKIGDTVSYVVTADEPLAAAPGITVTRSGGTEILAFAHQGDTTYIFTYEVKGGETDGSYEALVSLLDEAGNRAVDLPGVGFVIDATLPIISDAKPDKLRYSAKTGFNKVLLTFDSSESFDDEPAHFAVTIGGEAMSCGKFDVKKKQYACTYTVNGREGAGPKGISISAADRGGNTATLDAGAVTFDFSTPKVVSAMLIRDPALQSSVDDATHTHYFSPTDPFTDKPVKATLFVYADEEFTGFPSLVVTGPTNLSFADAGSTGAQAGFGYAFTGNEKEGQYTFAVRWKDDLGNEDTAPIPDLKMVVDNTPPDPAVSLDLSKVLYKRVPWGSDATKGIPKFSIAANTGAVKNASLISGVVVYRSATPSVGAIIGSATADPMNGAFAIDDLTGGDMPKVYLSLIDRSGAKSAPVLVTEVEWTATMGGKVPGSTIENPHTFLTTGVIREWLVQDPLSETEPTGSEIKDLSTADRVAILSEAETNWNELVPASTSPHGRHAHAMAYDAARGTVVMFGGYSPEKMEDTWEWNGTSGTWTDRTPAGLKPEARGEHALAYDAARGKVVLFSGGWDDTWEWDGATGTWTDRTLRTSTVPTPPFRVGHAMAYDAARGKVVLFGGFGFDETASLQDVWEWDGAAGTWTERTAAGVKPSPRNGHGLVYDAARAKVVLFGGTDGTTELQDTWEWNGTSGTWTQRTPAGPKSSARYGLAMAFDASLGKVMLFGGDDGVSKYDTWEWDGAAGTWTERTPSNSKPRARTNHEITYDAGRGKVILFGGYSDPDRFQDTWEWVGAARTWTDRTTAGTKPSARGGHAMAYDAARAKVVLHGGSDVSSGETQDTWEWDGANGTWTDRTPAGEKPSRRNGHAVAYDPVRAKVMLFGGHDGAKICSGGNSAYCQDTWEWDGTAGTWTDRTPTGTKPSARANHALAYDMVSGNVVLFGGSDATTGFWDTWEWDGLSGTWTNRVPAAVGPHGLEFHKMANDVARAKVVYFGGSIGFVKEQGIWEWDGSLGEWTDKTPTGVKPSARSGHALAYDAEHKKILMFGGGAPCRQDTWEWDGGEYTRPGQIMKAAFSAAGHSMTPSWKSVTATFYSGGDGYPLESEVIGVNLQVWDKGTWEVVATNNAPPEYPRLVTWTTTDPQVISRLFFGDQKTLNFAVTPVAPNGTGTGQIATDYAEVVVRYSQL